MSIFDAVSNWFLPSSIGTVNGNFDTVETELGNRLRRDGSLPMLDNLDMNSKRLLNLGDGTSDTDAATLGQVKAVPKGDKGDPGAAGNVDATLAGLKAAPITDVARIYDHAVFKWTTGDYTGQADDTNIIKSDDNDLSIGAWIRQKAASIQAADSTTVQQNLDKGGYFTAAGTGGLTRTGTSKASDVYSVFDTIPEAEHAAIVAGTSTYDCSSAVQQAIDNTAALGKDLFVPAGTYLFDPANPMNSAAGTCYRALALRSGMLIRAEKGAIFKIKDGVSTDEAVKFMAMFGTDETLDGIGIDGLTIDMNGQENPISPNRADGVYSLLNQAAFFVSGPPDGGAPEDAARIDKCRIAGCSFLNGPGVSCIVGAQTNVLGATLGSGWDIENNLFYNNGLDTIDHSSVFGWGEDVRGIGNRFINPTIFGPPGGNTAWEVHGARQTWQRNEVENYYMMGWIDGNYTNVADNILISYNIGRKLKGRGFEYYGLAPNELQTAGSKILYNWIELDDTQHPGENLKAGIVLSSNYTETNCEWRGNTVVATGATVATAGIVVQASTVAGHKHDNLLADGNTYLGTTFGFFSKTNDINGIGRVTYTNNRHINPNPAGVFASPMGEFYSFVNTASPIETLIRSGNITTDDRGDDAALAFGYYADGAFGYLYSSGNHVIGAANPDYHAATVTTRAGAFDVLTAYDPASLADGASLTTTVSVTGAIVGDIVRATFNVNLAGVDLSAWVSAADTVSVKFSNRTGAVVDLGAGTVRVRVEKAL